jgi:polyisoprenoid-binding protein YceI
MRGRRAAAWFGAVVAVAMLGTGPARAAGARFETALLDTRRSEAEFTIKAVWLIEITGRFGALSGSVRIDRFRSQASVDARIDANAVRMNSAGYERWVKSAEFFDVAAHPEIRFVSQEFPLQRLTRGGPVPGSLSVRGQTRPVEFIVAPAACARPAFECPVEASAAIRRSDFGMRSRRGMLADKVELRLSIYATGGDAS